MSSTLHTNKTKVFLSQFSIQSNKEKIKPTFSKSILATTIALSKSKNKLSHSSTFHSPPTNPNEGLISKLKHNFPNVQKANERIRNKYYFLPNIHKMRYLDNETLDIVLDQKESNTSETIKNNKRHRNKESLTKNENQLANELTSDNTVFEQEENYLIKKSKVLMVNVNKVKQKDMFKRMSTFNNDSNQLHSSSVRRSSIADNFAIKLINPEDCIEEYADQMRPGDTYKRLKKQLVKQTNWMNCLRLEIRRTHYLNQEYLKQYVNTLKRQKTIY